MFNKTKINFPIIPVCAATTICIIVFGFFLNKTVVEYGIRIEEKNFLHHTMIAASSLSPEFIASLRGKPTDIDSTIYQSIRSKLLRIKNANEDVRFVYLMSLKNDKIIFLVDAEPPTSADYSAPGDIYEEASPELFEIFLNAKPFLEGPIEDRWGVWISCLAPIFDPHSKKIIAIIGIDIDARTWQKNINVYKSFCYVITGLLIFVVLVYFSSLYKINSVNKKLHAEIKERILAEEEREKLIKKLQKALAEIKTLQGIIPICASCMKIRDDKGMWKRVEAYVEAHSEAQFSHGTCPDCTKKHYPDFVDENGNI